MNYAPEFSGVGRYTGELGAHFVRLGARVTVVTTPPHYPGWSTRHGYLNRYSVEAGDGQTIIRCPLILRSRMHGLWRLVAPLSFALSSAPVALWQILRRRPALVLCIEPTLLSAPLALVAARLAGARTVLHVQDLEVDAGFDIGHLGGLSAFRRLAMAAERRILRGFDRIVTISLAMRERITAKGVAPDRLAVVRNWVDLERIRPLAGSSYRRELGIADDVFVVHYSGNIGRKQALHLLVEAAELLASRRDILFVIAGEGPEKAALVIRAAGLPNVRFLGFQPEARMADFLALADLHALPQERGAADLVLPSKLGGMLASGRPIVATADPVTEIAGFLDGTAILTPPGEAEPLAAAIAAEADTRMHDGAAHVSARLALAARLARPQALDAFAAACSAEAGESTLGIADLQPGRQRLRGGAR